MENLVKIVHIIIINLYKDLRIIWINRMNKKIIKTMGEVMIIKKIIMEIIGFIIDKNLINSWILKIVRVISKKIKAIQNK